jgi:hypothetical protein
MPACRQAGFLQTVPTVNKLTIKVYGIVTKPSLPAYSLSNAYTLYCRAVVRHAYGINIIIMA